MVVYMVWTTSLFIIFNTKYRIPHNHNVNTIIQYLNKWMNTSWCTEINILLYYKPSWYYYLLYNADNFIVLSK